MPRTSEGQPRLALRTSAADLAGGGGPAGTTIAVTMGDPAGVGPEIALVALASLGEGTGAGLRLVGSRRVIDTCAARLGLDAPRRMLETEDEGAGWEPGRPTEAGARASLRAIEAAARLCLAGEADAMVTAPVSKSGIARAGYDFPGHTEFLAALTGADSYVMTFVSGARRIGLATTHLAISDVPGALSVGLIVEKLTVLGRGLREWFGIERPRIAVAALNPHAGEGGLLGGEDEAIVRPAIESARRAGLDAEGPFPADTIYVGLGEPDGSGPGAGYDAVLAMYHDQGTIPAKLMGFGSGVNVTLGLPIVRTSVDHGTAFDIAGRGTADPGSLIAAIDIARAIAARRAAGAVGSG